jgi:hypothetical protein
VEVTNALTYIASALAVSTLNPLKIYPNGDLFKKEIIEDNNKKSGIYR